MSKPQSTRPAMPERDATVAHAPSRPAPAKAVVIGQVKARRGKTYRVLAPAVAPQHLSIDEIERAVELMVAGR